MGLLTAGYLRLQLDRSLLEMEAENVGLRTTDKTEQRSATNSRMLR